MDADMPSDDRFLMVIRRGIERAAERQLTRHAKAGNPISRDKALSMAIEQYRQKLIQDAARFEREGSDGSADTFRELADLLPDAMREIGLR